MQRWFSAGSIALGLLGGPAAAWAAGGGCYAPIKFQPPHRPELQVFVYRPAKADAAAPVLFSIHGVGREAAKMCRDWQQQAEQSGQVIVVPWFDTKAYAGQSYNLGGIKAGGASDAVARSTYAVIEEIFDEVAQREQLSARSYRIFGHSAGAQVVHRAFLLGALPRATQVFSANAGYYTLPERTITWPYGLGGLALEPSAECTAFSRDLTVLLGENDKDPAFHSLNRSPQAMEQGPHRLARGENFYSTAARTAKTLGCDFNWKLVRVPGVGHQSKEMGAVAASLLR